MPKYLLLKHYRGGPERHHPYPPLDQWAPEEVDAHMKFMDDFGKRLEDNGEYVDAQALSPEGAWVRADEQRQPATDGPFAETKEQIGGFFDIQLPDLDTALACAEKIPASEYGSIEVRPVVERP